MSKNFLPLWLAMAMMVPAHQAYAECSYPTYGTRNGARTLSSFSLGDASNSGTVDI